MVYTNVTRLCEMESLYIHDIYNIYIIYTWYIHGVWIVYAVLTDMSGIYLVNTSWVCILWIYIVYHRYVIIKKGTEQNHEVCTRYIPDISVRTAYKFYIPCIYHVYTMYIPALFWYTCYNEYSLYILHGLSLVYTMCIPCIYMVYPQRYNVYQVYIKSRYNVYQVYIKVCTLNM